MKLNFIKASPSQNTTAIITNYVPSKMYSEIASLIMSYEYLHVEQVGFIVQPKNNNAVLKIEMSGGEFCGNALLSAAAYCNYKDLIDKKEFDMEISGVNYPLKCWVSKVKNNIFTSKAEMPSLISKQHTTMSINGKEIEGSIIHLDGISHFVTNNRIAKEEYYEILNYLKLQIDKGAIGIIPYQKVKEKLFEIIPMVYVFENDSTVFERACGSGTLALGIYMENEFGENDIKVKQPGGVIDVEVGDKNYISTTVNFTCEGTINV